MGVVCDRLRLYTSLQCCQDDCVVKGCGTIVGAEVLVLMMFGLWWIIMRMIRRVTMMRGMKMWK